MAAATGYVGGSWHAARPSTSTNEPRLDVLAPACEPANLISPTSFHQGSATQNVFTITLTVHGDSGCSLRGVPVLGYLDGPHHTLEGPPSTPVPDQSGSTSIELGPHSSTIINVWSAEPVALDRSYCGRLLPETGISLTFGATTFYVTTFKSSPPDSWLTTGACSRHSIFTSFNPEN